VPRQIAGKTRQSARYFLERRDELVVVMLDGWEESFGVKAEIRIAEDLGVQIRHLAPDFATG
jgi:uncharacterized protein DUF1937